MRIKHISILLFILAFAGVALVGATQAWAQCPPGINLNDCCCSADEEAANLCFNAFGYVVQVHADWTNASNPNIMDPGETSWEWPIQNLGDGTLNWQYKGCVADVSECSSQTWNYFVMEMHECAAANMTDTIPPGAQLLLPGDYVRKCTTFTAAPDHVLVKLNPSLNCGEGNEVIFSFFTTTDVPRGLNRSVVTYKRGCAPIEPFVEIMGPTFTAAPYVESVEMCAGEIVVTRDVCTGAPECVEINEKQAIPCQSIIVCFGDDPGSPGASYDCIDLRGEGEEAGPASTGCALDCDPFVYGYGENYWCENPDDTAPGCP
jgi:hypothetical protein